MAEYQLSLFDIWFLSFASRFDNYGFAPYLLLLGDKEECMRQGMINEYTEVEYCSATCYLVHAKELRLPSTLDIPYVLVKLSIVSSEK